jgi:hypothetical protein
MTWRLGSDRHTRTHLIALSSSGELLIFPVCHSDTGLTPNQFRFKDIAPGPTITAHPCKNLFEYGSITCYGSIVASTAGSDVFVRDLENGGPFLALITWLNVRAFKDSSSMLPAMSFTHNRPLLDESRVTHLHLVSERRLLVFLLQESKMCVDFSDGYTFGVMSLLIT